VDEPRILLFLTAKSRETVFSSSGIFKQEPHSVNRTYQDLRRGVKIIDIVLSGEVSNVVDRIALVDVAANRTER
jgi:hypothetical protein